MIIAQYLQNILQYQPTFPILFYLQNIATTDDEMFVITMYDDILSYFMTIAHCGKGSGGSGSIS